MKSRIKVVVAIAVFFSVCALLYVSRHTPTYNVVVISIDSLRADHMGTYGYSRQTTPNIDSFAQSSVVFDNYFSTSHLTPISEASVHTGVYPVFDGMRNFESSIATGTQTLAQVLRASGWQTAAYGSSLEFDYYPSIRDSFRRGFDTYSINSGYMKIPWRQRGQLHAEDAIAWMKLRARKSEPFFLWLAVGSAHWPYGEDEPHHFSDGKYDGFLGDSKSISDVSVEALFNKKYGRYFRGKIYDGTQGVAKQNASADLAYVINRYDDGLVMTDRKLAPLLKFLSNPEIANNTIVIIQSEHGEDFGEHGYIAHYDILGTQTHVPLIVRMPYVRPRHVDGIASGVDVFATIEGVLGLRSTQVLDGVDLSPYIREKLPASPRKDTFIFRTPLWERVISPYSPFLSAYAGKGEGYDALDIGIRTQRWLLVHRLSRDIVKRYGSWFSHLTGNSIPVDTYELYDIASDPGELHNVFAAHTQDQEIVALQKKLNEKESAIPQSAPAFDEPVEIQPYF